MANIILQEVAALGTFILIMILLKHVTEEYVYIWHKCYLVKFI